MKKQIMKHITRIFRIVFITSILDLLFFGDYKVYYEKHGICGVVEHALFMILIMSVLYGLDIWVTSKISKDHDTL